MARAKKAVRRKKTAARKATQTGGLPKSVVNAQNKAKDQESLVAYAKQKLQQAEKKLNDIKAKVQAEGKKKAKTPAARRNSQLKLSKLRMDVPALTKAVQGARQAVSKEEKKLKAAVRAYEKKMKEQQRKEERKAKKAARKKTTTRKKATRKKAGGKKATTRKKAARKTPGKKKAAKKKATRKKATRKKAASKR